MPAITARTTGSQGNATILQRLDAVVAAIRATPGQNTAGLKAVMGGVARSSRQQTRHGTRH
jgi:hypothetical protein